MINIYNFLLTNLYLYIAIIAVLTILVAILVILIINENKRNKIKSDYVQAEKLEEEIEKIEEKPENNELENIIKKMQEDVNIKPEDVVKKFEEEQEEKAIISYQELVDNVNSGKIEIIDDEDLETNYVENITSEPITEVNIENENSVTPDMVKEAIENISLSSVKEEPKKFENSKFISPIYGVMNENLDYPKVKRKENVMDLLNTNDYNELSEEIQKQEEFLKLLKEFRNNL